MLREHLVVRTLERRRAQLPDIGSARGELGQQGGVAQIHLQRRRESVAILTRGMVRKTGSVKELTQALEESPIVFRVAAPEDRVSACFQSESINAIATIGEGVVQVDAKLPDQPSVDQAVDALRRAGISILSMRRRDMTLEEAFLEIVKESGT